MGNWTVKGSVSKPFNLCAKFGIKWMYSNL